MAVIPAAIGYIIRHKTAGFDPAIADIPDMGMELALYLQAHKLVERAKERNIEVRFEGTFQTPWAMRARVAADRCFRPKLVYKTGELTETGKIIAERVTPVVSNLERDRPEDPDRWTEVDEMILRGLLTRRTIQLLNLFAIALREVTDYDKEWWTTENDVKKGEMKQTNMFEETEPNHELEEIKVAHAFGQSFIPLLKLKEKAKHDLNDLTRYGFVDLRLNHTGHRGRPRVSITVSDLGTRFLEDLERKGLL